MGEKKTDNILKYLECFTFLKKKNKKILMINDMYG